jgi:ribosomal protein S18 acetylase RimI-like enzyme
METRADITLRDARAEDEDAFFEFLLASTPEWEALLGEDTRDVVSHVYRKRGNLFSFQHVRVAEIHEQTAGMVLGYDWRFKQEQTLTTGILLLGHIRVKHLGMVPAFLSGSTKVGQVNKGEFFISNIAARPEFHGKGVGRALLDDTVQRARAHGAEAIALEVKESNKRAVRFYEKHGFEIDSEISLNVNGPEYLFRMIKDIV